MIDLSRAAEILEALANGVNPETGEALESESVLNQPDVIRSLYTGLSLIKKARIESKTVKSDHLPLNHGKPWKDLEVAQLTQKFNNGQTIKKISEDMQRTPGSVASQLKKMGYLVWNGEKYVRATAPAPPDLPPLPPLDRVD